LYHTFYVQVGGLSSLLFSLALGDQKGLKFSGSNQVLVYVNGDDDDDDDMC